jgi:hypothetical protein
MFTASYHIACQAPDNPLSIALLHAKKSKRFTRLGVKFPSPRGNSSVNTCFRNSPSMIKHKPAMILLHIAIASTLAHLGFLIFSNGKVFLGGSLSAGNIHEPSETGTFLASTSLLLFSFFSLLVLFEGKNIMRLPSRSFQSSNNRSHPGPYEQKYRILQVTPPPNRAHMSA